MRKIMLEFYAERVDAESCHDIADKLCILVSNCLATRSELFDGVKVTYRVTDNEVDIGPDHDKRH